MTMNDKERLEWEVEILRREVEDLRIENANLSVQLMAKEKEEKERELDEMMESGLDGWIGKKYGFRGLGD